MASTARINQVIYDFQSIDTEILVNGKEQSTLGIVDGLQEFDYSAKFNRTKFYGRSQLPVLITEGDADFAGSITIARFWFHWLTEKAVEFDIGLMDLHMNITLTYSGLAPGESEPKKYIDTLKGCFLGAINASGQHGSDPLLIKMPLDIMNVFFNGVDVKGRRLQAGGWPTQPGKATPLQREGQVAPT